jgi:acetoin:2,6-dichlorophenolindophenol oxidoreductase subunit alpha
MELSREQLLDAYRYMRLIREFEERIHLEFATGEIPGFVHLYAGEEASAVAICMNLGEQDYIASTHRGHGHCIAKGCDVPAMMKELYGRRDGLCGGKGGSMHIADMSKGMMGANGIVGGGPPLICGAALSAKILKTGGVAVTFFGDGGFNQGTTLEAMNLASAWKLPAVFVLEDNGYAESTASSWSIGGGDPIKRAAGFGLVGRSVEGHDFFATYQMARELIDYARAGNGPSFLHVKCTRFYGHFEGDASTYRAPGEVAAARNDRDCLKLFRDRVNSMGLLQAPQLDDIDSEVIALIGSAVAAAKEAPLPDAADLMTHVYSSY